MKYIIVWGGDRACCVVCHSKEFAETTLLSLIGDGIDLNEIVIYTSNSTNTPKISLE